MKLIPLTRGQYATVDDADYDWINQWKWYAQWNSKTRSFYAVRNEPRTDGKRYFVRMHRLILGLGRGDLRQGDHVQSGDTLDNRRCNLRIANRFENGYNRRPNRNSGSTQKGATYHRRMGKWQAQIQVNGVKLFLGSFNTETEAHDAYRSAAGKYHGDFARLA